MKSTRRQWCTRFALLAFLFGSARCLAPTLPVPPPVEPQMILDGKGNVIVRGGVDSSTPYSEIGVINSSLRAACEAGPCDYGRITVSDENGAWEVVLPGKKGDRLEIWQTIGPERSATRHSIVP